MHSHPSSASMAAVHSCFNSCSHKHKIIHLTIISSSQSSSSCSTNLSNNANVSLHSLKSSSSLTEKPLRNGKTRVSLMVMKPCSVKKKPVWKNLVFGSKRLRSIILLHIICIVYASNIAVIKDVEAFTDPAYFSAVRFVVSTIPFLPFILKARDDAEVRSSGLELGLWVSLGYLGEALGLVSADAGRASFISLFTVIVIPLLESLLGETVPARTWFGILMSVVGISMLECSGSPPNIGDLFNFLSAIFFGIHTLRTEQISKTTRKENFLALLGYEVVVVAILSTVWCLMGSNLDGIQENDGISWTWACFWDWILAFPWMPALYTGVFSTGLCLWGEIAALRDVSATETAVIYGLEPLWGAGFAWFLLGERWGLAGWIGAALILGGSLSVQILGASSNETIEVSNGVKENGSLMGSNKNTMKKTMSASPVISGGPRGGPGGGRDPPKKKKKITARLPEPGVTARLPRCPPAAAGVRRQPRHCPLRLRPPPSPPAPAAPCRPPPSPRGPPPSPPASCRHYLSCPLPELLRCTPKLKILGPPLPVMVSTSSRNNVIDILKK